MARVRRAHVLGVFEDFNSGIFQILQCPVGPIPAPVVHDESLPLRFLNDERIVPVFDILSTVPAGTDN